MHVRNQALFCIITHGLLVMGLQRLHVLHKKFFKAMPLGYMHSYPKCVYYTES